MLSPDHAARILHAIRAEQAAEQARRQAIVDAHRAGATFAELGRLLTVSRQAVKQLVDRHEGGI